MKSNDIRDAYVDNLKRMGHHGNQHIEQDNNRSAMVENEHGSSDPLGELMVLKLPLLVIGTKVLSNDTSITSVSSGFVIENKDQSKVIYESAMLKIKLLFLKIRL